MTRAFAFILWLLAGPLAAQQLEIRFLNVGQGDAALIREGRKAALIDAGAGAKIVSQLRALGIDTLDLVVASPQPRRSHRRHDRGAEFDGRAVLPR